MDDNRYTAEKLKKLRTRKNLTQKELAEDLGTSQQQIARYENGERNFKQDFLKELAEYFNVSIQEFFPGEIEDVKQTEYIPVYENINFKKINEYIEVPKSWIKNKKNVLCVKLNGNIILYKKENDEYLIYENTKKEN